MEIFKRLPNHEYQFNLLEAASTRYKSVVNEYPAIFIDKQECFERLSLYECAVITLCCSVSKDKEPTTRIFEIVDNVKNQTNLYANEYVLIKLVISKWRKNSAKMYFKRYRDIGKYTKDYKKIIKSLV